MKPFSSPNNYNYFRKAPPPTRSTYGRTRSNKDLKDTNNTNNINNTNDEHNNTNINTNSNIEETHVNNKTNTQQPQSIPTSSPPNTENINLDSIRGQDNNNGTNTNNNNNNNNNSNNNTSIGIRRTFEKVDDYQQHETGSQNKKTTLTGVYGSIKGLDSSDLCFGYRLIKNVTTIGSKKDDDIQLNINTKFRTFAVIKASRLNTVTIYSSLGHIVVNGNHVKSQRLSNNDRIFIKGQYFVYNDLDANGNINYNISDEFNRNDNFRNGNKNVINNRNKSSSYNKDGGGGEPAGHTTTDFTTDNCNDEHFPSDTESNLQRSTTATQTTTSTTTTTSTSTSTGNSDIPTSLPKPRQFAFKKPPTRQRPSNNSSESTSVQSTNLQSTSLQSSSLPLVPITSLGGKSFFISDQIKNKSLLKEYIISCKAKVCEDEPTSTFKGFYIIPNDYLFLSSINNGFRKAFKFVEEKSIYNGKLIPCKSTFLFKNKTISIYPYCNSNNISSGLKRKLETDQIINSKLGYDIDGGKFVDEISKELGARSYKYVNYNGYRGQRNKVHYIVCLTEPIASEFVNVHFDQLVTLEWVFDCFRSNTFIDPTSESIYTHSYSKQLL